MKFTTEMKTKISADKLSILRNIYQPIIGMEATALYHLLIDYQMMNQSLRTYFPTNEISKILNITHDQINQARIKLEAVGLVRTFEKADNETFIFKINPPMDVHQFRRNSILYRQAVSKIGEEIFERYEFSHKYHEFAKDDFKETTVKFQDIFDINTELKKQNTFDIPVPEIHNKDEAINALTTMQFVKYLTNKRVSPTLLTTMQDLQTIGFSSKSVNLICDYSFETNGKIVAKHVEVIGRDLFNKSVVSAKEIKMELDNAFSSKKVSAPVGEYNDIQLSKPTSTELEWDDLFDTLGDL